MSTCKLLGSLKVTTHDKGGFVDVTKELEVIDDPPFPGKPKI